MTGFFVLDGILTQEWDAAWDAFKHLILPRDRPGHDPFAVIFRITRASVLDVVDEDYVRTAKSKGLTPRVIRGRHILRNALLPVVTTIGLQTGACWPERCSPSGSSAFPGIGQASRVGFDLRDYPVLQVLILAAVPSSSSSTSSSTYLCRHRPPHQDEVVNQSRPDPPEDTGH